MPLAAHKSAIPDANCRCCSAHRSTASRLMVNRSLPSPRRRHAEAFHQAWTGMGWSGPGRHGTAPRDARAGPFAKRGKCQSASKPGSVWHGASAARDDHSSGTFVAERLTQPTRATGLETGRNLAVPRRPYSVLLPVGFTVPLPLPVARWALTPPFHPYRSLGPGGLLSEALSLGSPPPGVTRHRFSVEPGLSSPATFPCLRERPSSRLTRDT